MANKQSAALALAEELLSDIELDKLDAQKILLKASRLARLSSNDTAREWINLELYGYDEGESARAWMEWMGRLSGDGEKGYFVRLGELQNIIDSRKAELNAISGSSFTGEYIVPAQDRYHSRLRSISESIREATSITARVVSEVYSFATQTYYELSFSQIQSTLFESAREQVDGSLAPIAGGALEKIESINDRLQAGNPEAVSQAMSTCRRLIDSVANTLYPARAEPVRLGEESVEVKESHVLNRLKAYLYDHEPSRGRRDRLRRAIGDIYDRVSAGVHSEVSTSEAEFLFLSTYITLGEIITAGKVT